MWALWFDERLLVKLSGSRVLDSVADTRLSFVYSVMRIVLNFKPFMCELLPSGMILPPQLQSLSMPEWAVYFT